MIHWLTIIFGILSLAISISYPLYKLIVEKNIKVNIYFTFLFRILFFILGFSLVFLGLYFESIF